MMMLSAPFDMSSSFRFLGSLTTMDIRLRVELKGITAKYSQCSGVWSAYCVITSVLVFSVNTNPMAALPSTKASSSGLEAWYLGNFGLSGSYTGNTV